MIANVSDPVNFIRSIDLANHRANNVGFSYASQTLLYTNSSILLGDTSKGPINISAPNCSDSSNIYKFQDYLIYDDENGNLYIKNLADNSNKTLYAITSQIYTRKITYNANKNRILYLASPYLIITDPLLQFKQFVKMS